MREMMGMGQEALIISAVILLGSFTQGLTGFGLALVSVPLLSMALGVKMAVPLAGLFGWLVTFPIVWKMRRTIQWKTGLVLFLGSLPGSFLGASLLKSLPGDVILVAMGVVLVATAVYAFVSRGSVLKSVPASATLGAGFLSGALGACVGEPGPPAIAYTSFLPWSADQAKSTLVFFFMLQMMGAIASFYQKGLLTGDVATRFLWALPAFVVGAVLGMTAYGLLKRHRFNYHHIVHGFLLVIGMVLIVKHV
jgi:hypothetical protein